MYGYPPPQPVYRQEKSYLGEAFITLVLYYVGLWVAGLIANIIFLNNAKRDQSMGIMTSNVGCLQLLLWWHIIGAILACIVTVILLATGTLATLMASMGG